MSVKLVNNTMSDLRGFRKYFINCIENKKELPEEFTDIFKLEIIENENKTITTAILTAY